jgi:signal transduction histidine kinase
VDAIQERLRWACEASGARWAALARRAEGGWRLEAAHGLATGRREALAARLADPEWGDRWERARPLKGAALGVGPGQVYVFRNANSPALTLAGAGALDRRGRAALRALAAGQEEETAALGAGGEGSFDALLTQLREGLAAQAALLARRLGEEYRVEAAWQMPKSLLGAALMVGEAADALPSPEGGRLRRAAAMRALGVSVSAARKYEHWLVAPIRQGGRVMGLLACSARRRFTNEELRRATSQAREAAAAFRGASTAADAREAVHRLRMVNDMASLADLPLDRETAARGIQRLLLRGFPADAAEVLLLTPDGKCLQAAAPARKGAGRARYPLDSTLVGAVHRIGRAVRIGNLAHQSEFSSPRRGVAAKMAAPLTLQDQVTGVLSLESRRLNAFSAHDEESLTLLARMAAGLIEAARQSEQLARGQTLQAALSRLGQEMSEARTRAAICQATAEWTVDGLGADLGLAMTLDAAREELVTQGVAGRRAGELPRGVRFATRLGSFGEALQYGRSLLIHDIRESGDSFPVPGWEGGSAMCVPLVWRDAAVGALLAERADAYAFMAEDLAALELAARLTALRLEGADAGEDTQTALRSMQEANRRLQEELAERKQAQDLAEERLVRSAKLAAVGEMAAGVAHELNNPLTTVAGFAELILEQTAAEAPWRGDLELVLGEARRARAVVRRLLDFSRPSEILRVRADLNEELGNVVSLVHHMARTSGVAMRVALWDDLPLVRIDRNQIQQVFLNLLHNAIQAMPGGGELTLRTQVQTQRRKKYVTASIEDNGEGIAAEYRDKIFEPFFTTKGPGSGTGLGLSVSYGIVDDHGGFIDVESEEGQGATFTVWLPVDEAGGGGDE